MPRNARQTGVNEIFASVFDPHGPPPGTLVDFFESLRGEGREDAVRLESAMIQKCRDLQKGLQAAEKDKKVLLEMVDRLSEEPWYSAVFLRLIGGRPRPRAEVLHLNRRCVVGISPEIDHGALVPGQEVLVNRQGSAVMEGGSRLMPPGGVMASFVRWEVPGRMVVDAGHEEVLLEALPALAKCELEAGDLIRAYLDNHLAVEKIQRPAARHLVGESPNVSRAQLGGQEENFRKLKLGISASLMHREKAAQYGLDGKNSVLLVGPPGTGKTLMVKIASTELQHEHGVQCSFVVVKPGEFGSMWYSETERNIRATFESLRRLTEQDGRMVILYLDEVDSIGRHRGTGVGTADDKALNALLAEIDGFVDRKNICIVASTNKKELIDPSLLDRIAGVELVIRRPNAMGAREIFDIHMPGTLPYSPNGSSAPATRDDLIEAAISRLYSPNAENKVAVIRFTDGKQRDVHAWELISGRVIEQICKAARLSAFERDVERGDAGIQADDMAGALDDAIEKMRTSLTRGNAQNYLDDLPQDIGILAVDAVRPHPARPRRYLNHNQDAHHEH